MALIDGAGVCSYVITYTAETAGMPHRLGVLLNSVGINGDPFTGITVTPGPLYGRAWQMVRATSSHVFESFLSFVKRHPMTWQAISAFPFNDIL
jgi:hypothetical protein